MIHPTLTTTLAMLAYMSGMGLGETVHGVVVYSRHGDRTTKHYGSQVLTSLGAEQNFQVGSDYRQRYLETGSPHQILGISADKYVPGQIYATAPDQSILLNTATAFLQGLYPPLVGRVDESVAAAVLNNGSAVTGPLNGYQYVLLHGQSADSADAVWIKGDDGCPTNAAAGKSFFASAEFKQRERETREFYRRFYDVLVEDVYDVRPEKMTYRNAYDIFDLINVARIHNATSAARNVSDADLLQLRTLADSAEMGYNYNASQPARSIHGRTLAAALLRQLRAVVDSRGASPKLSLLAGSYDTFQAFMAEAGLPEASADFLGMPEYASTMAFELFSSSDGAAFPADSGDLRVRFLFRNGTAAPLQAWPLFGSGDQSLAWPRFAREMEARSISTAAEWCDVCESKMSFCAAFAQQTTTAPAEEAAVGGAGAMSNAVAGVIGAVVALAVAGLVAAGAVYFKRRTRRNRIFGAAGQEDKASSKSSNV